jgi:hypothetical protein
MRNRLKGFWARRIAMPTVSAALIMVAVSARPASATTITFDELNCGDPVTTEASLTFSGAAAVCNSAYTNDYGNSSYGAFPSGSNSVINTGVDQAGIIVTGATPFTFYGIWAAALEQFDVLDPAYSSATLEIDGYLNGNLVGTITETLSDLFTYFSVSGVFGDNTTIDTLVFLPDGTYPNPTYFLLDDMVLTPEPAQLVLFGSGLFLLAMALRRHRNKTAGPLAGRS